MSELETTSIYVKNSVDSITETELDQGVVAGEIYVVVEVNPTPTLVEFYLDDPDQSHPPIRTDQEQPFDIVIDTTQLADGTHTLTVVSIRRKGKSETANVTHAVFTVSQDVVQDPPEEDPTEPEPEPEPEPAPTTGDVIVTQSAGGYDVNGRTYAHGFEAINAAIDSLTSGTVLVRAGIYDVGMSRVLSHNGSWMSAHSAVSVTNGSAGFADGHASTISVNSNPGSGTLVAFMDFPTPVARSEIATMGFWALPNQVFSDRGMNGSDNGGPFDVVLDDSPSCTSPQFQQELVHPEWLTDEWKWYTLSGGIGIGRTLPSSLGTVRCIGIVWKDNYSGAATRPAFPHALTVDDVEGTVNGSWISTKSDVKLLGEGAGVTVLRASRGLNFPMVNMSGSNIEVGHLELDGNFSEQQAIDYVPGIHNGGGGSGSKLHNLYIHHVRGEGIKIRGQNIEIHSNLIEWTENAQISTSATASDVHIHHNTLKYGTNDGNLWLFGGSNITMEYNTLHDITQEAIDADAAPLIAHDGDWVPFTAKDGASGWVFRFNRLYGGSYAVQLANGASDGTIENNLIIGSSKQGIVMWGADVSNVEILRNVVESSASTGVQTAGSGHRIWENWTRSNDLGMDLTRATSQSGEGNYSPDGYKGSDGVHFSESAAPAIDEDFDAGAPWTSGEDLVLAYAGRE